MAHSRACHSSALRPVPTVSPVRRAVRGGRRRCSSFPMNSRNRWAIRLRHHLCGARAVADTRIFDQAPLLEPVQQHGDVPAVIAFPARSSDLTAAHSRRRGDHAQCSNRPRMPVDWHHSCASGRRPSGCGICPSIHSISAASEVPLDDVKHHEGLKLGEGRPVATEDPPTDDRQHTQRDHLRDPMCGRSDVGSFLPMARASDVAGSVPWRWRKPWSVSPPERLRSPSIPSSPHDKSPRETSRVLEHIHSFLSMHTVDDQNSSLCRQRFGFVDQAPRRNIDAALRLAMTRSRLAFCPALAAFWPQPAPPQASSRARGLPRARRGQVD
jgi:hypothetical protein